MRGKTFLILLVAAGVLVAVAFFRFSDKPQTGDTKMGKALFADLPVNQVASITLTDQKNSVTLIKGDKAWQVKDRSGYPADFGELREMVVKLSRLKIGRSFNGTVESLARLSLLAPSAENEKGRGVQITLKDSSSKVLADVIIGQARQAEGGGSGGQYLKKTDDDTVFLVDGSFRFLKTSPADWLQDEILNIKGDVVASVTCYAGDKTAPVYTLTRPEKGEKPQMSPIPTGRSVDVAKIDQVFDALAPLTLADVATAADHPKTDDTRKLVYRLYDGRQITLSPESDGKEKYWVRVSAETVASETAEAGTDESATPDKSESEKQEKAPTKNASADKKDEKAAPAVKTVEQINADVQPWVFSVKKWQYDSLITQVDGLLEAVETKDDQSS